MYCELGSCFSIPFPEYWERALRNLILVLIFETVMNATNHCHSWARILLGFHHHQHHQQQQQQEMCRRYSRGQEFILSSFRPDQTSRLAAARIQIQNYYYLVETIFSPYLARACHWRWSGYTHNLVVVCFHIPAGVIFIRRHISTFSCRYYRYYRYYRYLHHCCVSCKHTKCTVHSVELYCPYL